MDRTDLGLLGFKLPNLYFDWRRPFASAYFRSAGSYVGLKQIAFMLIGLVMQYLLTHHLTTNDYGLLVWVGTIVGLLSPLGLPGISTSITGAVAKGYDGNFRHGTWLEIAGGTVGGLVLLGIAGYYWFFAHEAKTALIFVIAGVLGPGLWLDTHQCYWNGKKNFRALFLWAVPVRFLHLLTTAAVLFYSSSPVLVFGVQTVIQVTANIGAAIGIMKLGGINQNTSDKYHDYGWFYTKLNWIGNLSAQMDKLVIGAFFGLESLAVFAVGELLYTYFYTNTKAFLAQIFLPRMAEMEIKQAARWVRTRQLYLEIGIVLMVLLLGLAIPVVYPLLFSAKYKDSIYYAYLFLGCIVLGGPSILSGTLLKAQAMKKETLVGWAILSFIPIVFIPVFGWFFGITGVVLARGLSYTVNSGYYLWLLKDLTDNGKVPVRGK